MTDTTTKRDTHQFYSYEPTAHDLWNAGISQTRDAGTNARYREYLESVRQEWMRPMCMRDDGAPYSSIYERVASLYPMYVTPIEYEDGTTRFEYPNENWMPDEQREIINRITNRVMRDGRAIGGKLG